jgi:hypothetical protein
VSVRIYVVQFTLSGTRETPIGRVYRPDWVSLSKPERNCAQLTLAEGRTSADPSRPVQGLLVPLRPELWERVTTLDVLEAFEGRRSTGTALVLDVYDVPLPKRDPKGVAHGRCAACQRVLTSRWTPGILSGYDAPEDLAPFQAPCPHCGGSVEPIA